MHVRLTGHKPSDPLAQEGMVVDRQDPDRASIATHDFNSVSFPANFPDNFSVNQERRRAADVSEACEAGMLNSTSVPESSSLHTASLPPTTLARSRMPCSP